jgi:hypothetical protein
MERLMLRSARPIALLALTIGTVLAASAPTPPSPASGPAEVESLGGAGVFDKVVCLGCAAALLGGGGATLGGLLLEATFFPEAVGACAYTCIVAFTE